MPSLNQLPLSPHIEAKALKDTACVDSATSSYLVDTLTSIDSQNAHHLRAQSDPVVSSPDKTIQKKIHRRGNSTLTAVPSPSLCSLISVDQDILAELSESLRLRQKILGDNHPTVAESYNLIGNVHFRRGEYDLASEKYTLALNSFRKSYVKTRQSRDDNTTHRRDTSDVKIMTSIAVTLCNLGTVCWATGKLDESIRILDEALDIYFKVYSINDDCHIEKAEIGSIYYNLGIARFLRSEYDLSKVLMEKAHSIWEAMYGSQHITTARALDALGKISLTQGRVDAALRYHEMAMRIKSTLMGSHHPSVLFSMTNLASAYKEKGEFEKSISLLESIARFQEERMKDLNGSRPSNEIDLGNTRQKIGRILLIMGRTNDGVRECINALVHYKKAGLDKNDFRVCSLYDFVRSIPDFPYFDEVECTAK